MSLITSQLHCIAVRLGALFVAALLIGFAWQTVSLTPHVDPSFFFGDEDPQLEQDAKVYKLFPRQDQIIINIEGKISSAEYLNKLDRLSRRLLAIPQVVSARSLTHGPKSFDDALKSSFWGRLLIPEDRKSSNVFVALAADSFRDSIPKIETSVRESETDSFRPVIAGIPYMIELIRRNLVHDLKVFSLSAIVIFGVMIFFLFRSFSSLFGSIAAGAAATALTLLLNQMFEIEIGILTANLVTLVLSLRFPMSSI